MSEDNGACDECRHLPAPVWNPARCEKCGAVLTEPIYARVLAAAKFWRRVARGLVHPAEYMAERKRFCQVIAEAELCAQTMEAERKSASVPAPNA